MKNKIMTFILLFVLLPGIALSHSISLPVPIKVETVISNYIVDDIVEMLQYTINHNNTVSRWLKSYQNDKTYILLTLVTYNFSDGIIFDTSYSLLDWKLINDNNQQDIHIEKVKFVQGPLIKIENYVVDILESTRDVIKSSDLVVINNGCHVHSNMNKNFTICLPNEFIIANKSKDMLKACNKDGTCVVVQLNEANKLHRELFKLIDYELSESRLDELKDIIYKDEKMDDLTIDVQEWANKKALCSSYIYKVNYSNDEKYVYVWKIESLYRDYKYKLEINSKACNTPEEAYKLVVDKWKGIQNAINSFTFN